MKYTSTEVEEFIDKILFSVRYAKEGHDDYESALNDIEERCRLFRDEYICPYEKHTEEWYDEHGE